MHVVDIGQRECGVGVQRVGEGVARITVADEGRSSRWPMATSTDDLVSDRATTRYRGSVRRR
ncbi:hypothetical protein ACNQVK_00005, partial [Mycobacterium sp. 134]|uniref:hypothetical protein n=1 Tax=Mycobacterium sp. 134 TaxID=3400425 RepID=UPI003AAE9A26